MGSVIFLQATALNPGNLIVFLISSADLVKRNFLHVSDTRLQAESMAEEEV
jgi:hypothetical protein